ncbi:hypothetical protein GCM10023331_08130 [Algivirga pacifica]|uniref:Uncharacterized protein n=2 Tax=Algivirga pacifica TaxID=1162670 RepID=A0ABP9D2A0_9BACT
MVAFTVSNDATAQRKRKTIGKKMDTPFSQKRYKTDKKAFRAIGNGKSRKERSAMLKARTDAQRKLAEEMKAVVKTVTEEYMKEYEVGDTYEFQSMMENKTIVAAKASISGASEMDSEVYTIKQKKNGEKFILFNAYVVLEMDKETFKQKLNNEVMKEKKNEVEFSKEKFNEIFDKEMESLESEM